MTINALGGTDTVLSNDTAAVTLIQLGGGDDQMVVGTVPLKPDTGNRTLEFPDGVPVVDSDGLTNGNSNPLFAMGEGGNDNFEVNFNRAQLYLHGGKGDDRFLLKTFLVLKEDAARPDEVTNLNRVFGGEGSNRYDYLENGPVEINGGPGIDTLVLIGTPIGDVFVITSNLVAGAGRIVAFRNIEALEINGGGGNDRFYILSTNESFTTTIVGGSGDDVIHIGGDHPPIVFDPPSFEYTPPPLTVQLPPQLNFVQEQLNFGNFVFEYNLSFWETIFSFFNPSLLQTQAVQAVEQTIHGWFDSWRTRIPNFRNERLEYDGIFAESIIVTSFFGLVFSNKIRVTVQNLRVSYERGVLTSATAQVQPEKLIVDPPPFVLKLPARMTVEGIQGRVILDGGETVEAGGDTVIVHNGSGLAQSGMLINRIVPRFAQVGLDQNGDPIYEQQDDQRFVELVGLGMTIPLAGFVAPDTSKSWGVLLRGIENIDLRLADEQPGGGISRNDDFTVALAERRGQNSLGHVIPGLVPLAERESVALRIVAGDGNDLVTLKQITGPTTVLGGDGDDTLTVADGATLENIRGEVRFDGAAHIDELTTHIANLSEVGLPNSMLGTFPSVFVNTANPTHSFVDAFGQTIRYSDAVLQQVIYRDPTDGLLYLNAVVLRDGTVVRDFVQEEGVQERGVVERGRQKKNSLGIQHRNSSNQLVYLDENGDQTTTPTDTPFIDPNDLLWLDESLQPTTFDTGMPLIISASSDLPADSVKDVYINASGNRVLVSGSPAAGLRPSIITAMSDPSAQLVHIDVNGNKTFTSRTDGYLNPKSFVTKFPGTELWVDNRGLRRELSAAMLVVDASGADFKVYAKPGSDFAQIRAYVSVDGTSGSWVEATRGTTTSTAALYSIGLGNNTAYRYIQLVGQSGDFFLDGLEILVDHGGPESSTAATAFPTSIKTGSAFTTVPTGELAAAVGAPNALFAQLKNRLITYQSNGKDLPALIQVNRMETAPFTTTRDDYKTFTGDTDRLVVNGSSESGMNGSQTPTPIGVDRIVSGEIEFHQGTVTETLALAAGGTTATIGTAPHDPSRVVVIATRALGSTEYSSNAITNRVTIAAPATPIVVRVVYNTTAGTQAAQTFQVAPGTTTLQLRDDLVSGGVVSVTTYEALAASVSGSTLTVGSASAARTLIVNYPTPSGERTYVGGERVLKATQDVDGKIVLSARTHAANDGVYDQSASGRPAVNDPFGIQLRHIATDEMQHFAGDPVLHDAGALRRYLGGEPVVDEPACR